MPMTRRANTALDRVRGREAEIVEEMVEYAGSDLLCYRAERPEGLVSRPPYANRQTEAGDRSQASWRGLHGSP